MTVGTDPYLDILFNDGEGADFADFNNARGYLGARLLDQIIGKRVVQALAGSTAFGGGPVAANQLAHVATALDCTIGGAGTTLSVGEGTVFQQVATRDGLESKLLAFEVGASQFTFTIGPGDATNPRIDIVQIKLELVNGDSATRNFKDATTGVVTSTSLNKSRRVRATCTVKQGVAAAVPQVPAPDAGFAILGAVRLNPGATTNLRTGPTNVAGEGALWSLGVPLGVSAYTVPPSAFDYSLSAGGWSLVSGFAKSTAAASGLRILGPTQHGRIVGISVSQSVGGAATQPNYQVNGMTYTAGSASSLVITNLDPTVGTSSRFVTMAEMSALDTFSSPNAAGIGIPVWCNGYLTPAQAADPNRVIGLLVNSTGGAGDTKVGPVTFWVAGG